MLKQIFSAIASALMSVGRMLGRVVGLPFRVLDYIVGGPPVPPMPETSMEADDVPGPAPDDRRHYEQVALAVMQWCIDSLVADGPAPIPPKMPRKIAAWLPGLTREECIFIGGADRNAVSAHIRSYELIRGVRSVRSLDRVDWPPESGFAPDHDSGGFLSALAAVDTASVAAEVPAHG
jgi:hypothetical protein